MKIAIIADKVGCARMGGYERRLCRLAGWLSQSHEVAVYAQQVAADGVRMDRIRYQFLSPVVRRHEPESRSMSRSLLFAVGLRRNIFGPWCPDVLLVNAIPYGHLWTMSRWVSSFTCRKVIDVSEAWSDYSPTGGTIAKTSVPAVRWLMARGLEWADQALTPSGATALSLDRTYGFNRTKVVPSGIDFREPREDLATRDATARFDFVTVGRLVAIKRQADFVEALAQLVRLGWRGKAAVVGSGPLEHAIRRQISSLGLESRVVLFNSATDEQRDQVLADSRLFVLCSEREGQSIATLEAMGQGVPPLVAKPPSDDVFGASSMVATGVNGMYYRLGNVADLARAMGTLLADPSERVSLGKAALSTARNYDWKTLLPRFGDALGVGL